MTNTKHDPETWETPEFFAWLQSHDADAAVNDRLRRLQRDGASETQLQAEALRASAVPSLYAGANLQ